MCDENIKSPQPYITPRGTAQYTNQVSTKIYQKKQLTYMTPRKKMVAHN